MAPFKVTTLMMYVSRWPHGFWLKYPLVVNPRVFSGSGTVIKVTPAGRPISVVYLQVQTQCKFSLSGTGACCGLWKGQNKLDFEVGERAQE